MNNFTIKELVKDFYENNKSTLVGNSNVKTDNDIINVSALPWLSIYAGKIYQNITKNENLNSLLIEKFAQTFVRYFWNMPIGYDNVSDFFIHLKAFLDENLPIWAQFFKEGILKHALYTTTYGVIKVSGNGTLHYEGQNESNENTTNTGNNKGGTTTTTNGKNTTNTDSKSSANTLSATADTPQNQLNLSFNSGNEDDNENYIEAGTGSYNFDYASKVDGSITGNTANQKAEGTNDSTTTVQNNGTNSTNEASKDSGSDQHDQITGNANKQHFKQRQQALAEMSEQINRLENGIYQNLFLKAKKEGLFSLTY